MVRELPGAAGCGCPVCHQVTTPRFLSRARWISRPRHGRGGSQVRGGKACILGWQGYQAAHIRDLRIAGEFGILGQDRNPLPELAHKGSGRGMVGGLEAEPLGLL